MKAMSQPLDNYAKRVALWLHLRLHAPFSITITLHSG